MGLEKLREDIREDSEKQAAQIIAQARSTAREEESKAEAEAKAIVARALGEAQETSKEQFRMVSGARLRARKIIASARDAVVQRSMDSLLESLREIASSGKPSESGRYAKAFAALAKKAVKEVGPGAVLYCRRQDEALGQKIARVAGSIDCIGGAIAESADGLVRADNTFEAIAEEQADRLRAKAHGEIFGTKGKARRAHAGNAQEKPKGRKPILRGHSKKGRNKTQK
ncbi:hypothetical protein HY095_05875 [Candidatus Micrarchaeota archaeon]|nr:hypothetical protein [Candidatus Micrarchaeota archaeon]